MNGDEKVVYLAVSNDKLRDDNQWMLSCSLCRNKAFSILAPPEGFRILKCTACGMQIGRFGWVPDDHS